MDSFLLWILVVTPIYQDSRLANVLGSAGSSLVPEISFIIFLFILFKERKIRIYKPLIPLIRLGVWLIIISYCGVVVWLMAGGDIYINGESLLIKPLKIITIYFSYIIYCYDLIWTARRLSIKKIFFPLFGTIVLLTLICIFEIPQLPYAYPWFHASNTAYGKIRLLTREASATAPLVLVYSLLSVFGAKLLQYKKLVFLFVGCMIIQVFFSQSKLMLGLFLVFLFVFILMNLKSSRFDVFKKWIPLILVGGVISFWFIYPKLKELFVLDFVNYTSTATRAYTGIIGLTIGIQFPIGVGCGAYLPVFKNFLTRFLPIFSKLNINLNLNEINGLLVRSDDRGMTPLAGMMTYTMYWGIVGTVVYIRALYKPFVEMDKNSIISDTFVKAFWVTLIIMMCVGNAFSYEFYLAMAYIQILSDFRNAEIQKD